MSSLSFSLFLHEVGRGVADLHGYDVRGRAAVGGPLRQEHGAAGHASRAELAGDGLLGVVEVRRAVLREHGHLGQDNNGHCHTEDSRRINDFIKVTGI